MVDREIGPGLTKDKGRWVCFYLSLSLAIAAAVALLFSGFDISITIVRSILHFYSFETSYGIHDGGSLGFSIGVAYFPFVSIFPRCTIKCRQPLALPMHFYVITRVKPRSGMCFRSNDSTRSFTRVSSSIREGFVGPPLSSNISSHYCYS